MLISGWKNKIMTACMGLLILISLITLIHWGVKAITVKIPRLYNYSIIKMALAGTPSDKDEKNPAKNIHIDWAKLYPFDNTARESSQKVYSFPQKHKQTPAERLGDWAKSNMFCYHSVAEL